MRARERAAQVARANSFKLSKSVFPLLPGKNFFSLGLVRIVLAGGGLARNRAAPTQIVAEGGRVFSFPEFPLARGADWGSHFYLF